MNIRPLSFKNMKPYCSDVMAVVGSGRWMVEKLSSKYATSSKKRKKDRQESEGAFLLTMIAHRNESAFLLPCLLSEQRRLARTEKTAYERYGQLAIASYSRHRHVASIGTGVGDSRLFVSSPLGARSVRSCPPPWRNNNNRL
jgi:hypothetical protein